MDVVISTGLQLLSFLLIDLFYLFITIYQYICPLPVIWVPFKRVIVDCVGPSPKVKSGNQFMLTRMCTATCFPEAILRRKITTPVVIKALTNMFCTCGLPKVVQTDQGSHFLSRQFGQVLKVLGIRVCIAEETMRRPRGNTDIRL